MNKIKTNMTNKLNDDEKEFLLKSQPKRIVDNFNYKFFRFNWKKILLVDGVILIFSIVSFFKRMYEGEKVIFSEYIIFFLVFVVGLTFIAFVIDFIRGLSINNNKDSLYIMPIYKHAGIKGNCYITFHNVFEHKLISVVAKINEEDRFKSDDNAINWAVMKIYNNKMKYVKMYYGRGE